MAYATREQLTALVGEDVLSRLADRDGDFVADPAIMDAALVRASSEIDSHIGARYPLPLPETPETLVQLAADIALYRLAVDGGMLTDDIRQRYEDALAFLGKLSSGRAVLVFTPDPDVTEPEGPQPLVTAGPERVFTRDKMRGL